MTRGYQKTYTAKGKVYSYFRPPRSLVGVAPTSIRVEPGDQSKIADLIAHYRGAREDLSEKALKRHLRLMWGKARWRAGKLGLAFEITKEDVLALLASQKLRCAMSGLRFDMRAVEGGYRGPYRPSIDRIEARGGYTPDNVRLVIVAVNTALADWGDEVFW
ncbi:MAG TPA: hypothetical protein VM434_05020 [Beijerinckiaceae bacterium]|nr:hypothetical protein [Beijerinckiaceae bacterium]